MKYCGVQNIEVGTGKISRTTTRYLIKFLKSLINTMANGYIDLSLVWGENKLAKQEPSGGAATVNATFHRKTNANL